MANKSSQKNPLVTFELPMRRRSFGTFWMGGALSAIEQACLNSFVSSGQDLTVFSYEKIPNLPKGVALRDASEIVAKIHVNSFLYKGKPDIAHFSDYFRIAMIERASLCWVDTDIIFLGDGGRVFELDNIYGKEKAGSINNAVLYIDDRAVINSYNARLQELMEKDLKWGETGPILLHDCLKKQKLDVIALDYSILYPISHDDIGKVFLPEFRDWCEAACQRAVTLHLFNNVIVRMGIWKMMAPPVGSYLHACFKKSDSLHFFSDTFPEGVMRQLIQNFRASQTGSEIGFRAILREFFPSLKRSLVHRALWEPKVINHFSKEK